MDKVLLPSPEHRHAKTRREADRIEAVVLLGKAGLVAVAETLLLDEGTVRSYRRV